MISATVAPALLHRVVYAKGVSMANKDMGRKSRNESRDEWTDRDDRVRGRADEMEDASNESEEFEDVEDLNDEDEEDRDGSF
jgi:hypothetical protein